MVAQEDSNNDFRNRTAYSYHNAATMSVYKHKKRPTPSRLYRHQPQRSSKSVLPRKALIKTIMSNQHSSRGVQEGAAGPEPQFTATHESYPLNCHMPTASSSVVAHSGQVSTLPFAISASVILRSADSVSTVVELLGLMHANRLSCEHALCFMRFHIRFNFILFDLRQKLHARALLTEQFSPILLSGIGKVLEEVDKQLPSELHDTLCNINDLVCQFVCCSTLLVDRETDPFFKHLTFDNVRHILQPSSLAVFANVISFIRPPVHSLTLSPIPGYSFAIIAVPFTRMIRAVATSMRELALYLPDDDIMEVFQNASFALNALEALHIKMQRARFSQYNALEASHAVYELFSRISSVCPRLKYFSLENEGVGTVPDVRIQALPAALHHIVSIKDTNLLRNFGYCNELKSITIFAAHIDFQQFVLFENDSSFPQLERVHFVNCIFDIPSPERHRASRRLRECVRTIRNEVGTPVSYFPVESLPELMMGNFALLEVLELNLYTEADCYICEMVSYVVGGLHCLKSFTLQVLDTKLREERIGDFRRLFNALLESESALEHVRMRDIWVSTRELYPFLRRKGASLKTVDVKLHRSSCVNENEAVILNWEDLVEVLRCLARWCPRIWNVSIAERRLLHRAIVTNVGEFERCVLREGAGRVKRMWEEVMLGFDRWRVSAEIQLEATRDAFG
eukprot:TRINITY_DN63085_c0_g1_i1.p1 TRINITY_DN63085_c0_g1~~TRINITY_DN63085_c0_g1_i1.p1  ORF type:complete len:683 (+),score=80.30 TRINITY_DN63085_c0_g1_i1:2160-4208(+)